MRAIKRENRVAARATFDGVGFRAAVIEPGGGVRVRFGVYYYTRTRLPRAYVVRVFYGVFTGGRGETGKSLCGGGGTESVALRGLLRSQCFSPPAVAQQSRVLRGGGLERQLAGRYDIRSRGRPGDRG